MQSFSQTSNSTDSGSGAKERKMCADVFGPGIKQFACLGRLKSRLGQCKHGAFLWSRTAASCGPSRKQEAGQEDLGESLQSVLRDSLDGGFNLLPLMSKDASILRLTRRFVLHWNRRHSCPSGNGAKQGGSIMVRSVDFEEPLPDTTRVTNICQQAGDRLRRRLRNNYINTSLDYKLLSLFTLCDPRF